MELLKAATMPFPLTLPARKTYSVYGLRWPERAKGIPPSDGHPKISASARDLQQAMTDAAWGQPLLDKMDVFDGARGREKKKT